jgi:hypothetical protein
MPFRHESMNRGRPEAGAADFDILSSQGVTRVEFPGEPAQRIHGIRIAGLA